MTLEQFRNSYCEFEEQAAIANAFDDAVVRTIPMGTAYFLARRLANATMQHGYSAVSHNSLAKVCRSSPRKIGKAVRALIENGFVSYEGRADNGAPIYKCCWERAVMHRDWMNANHEAQLTALRTNREFVSPAYPEWENKSGKQAA
jgi:hypothetical protein